MQYQAPLPEYTLVPVPPPCPGLPSYRYRRMLPGGAGTGTRNSSVPRKGDTVPAGFQLSQGKGKKVSRGGPQGKGPIEGGPGMDSSPPEE